MVDVGPGIRHNGPMAEHRYDAGMEHPLLVLIGGGAADKALASLGEVGAQHKVQLSASPADMLGAGGLRIHLPEQVYIHRIIDGDEVVQLGDHSHVVGVIHRGGHTGRIVV